VGLGRAAWLERRYGAAIDWRPFDLHPEYPPEGIPRAELERRYGAAFSDRLRAMFDAEGLPHADALDLVPNSRRALMLSEFARERGAFEALHRRLFDAYWARGRDIGDQGVLIEEGTAVGLEESDVVGAIENQSYLARVEEETQTALKLGAGGVPAWVIDRRLLVPGAQPEEVFAKVFERLGYS
jgi:predicted DsbA family dithiol-disulfide isomerase